MAGTRVSLSSLWFAMSPLRLHKTWTAAKVRLETVTRISRMDIRSKPTCLNLPESDRVVDERSRACGIWGSVGSSNFHFLCLVDHANEKTKHTSCAEVFYLSSDGRQRISRMLKKILFKIFLSAQVGKITSCRQPESALYLARFGPACRSMACTGGFQQPDRINFFTKNTILTSLQPLEQNL